MPRKPLQTIALTLILSGLLLATAACQDLASDASDTTSSVTTTTATEGVDLVPGETIPPGAHGGGGDDEPVPWGSEATEPPGSGDGGLFGTAAPFATETTERWPGWPSGLTLDNGNDGDTWPIAVGNTLTVELRFLIGEGVADARWTGNLPSLFRQTDWEETRGRFGRFCSEIRGEFEITDPGEGRLLIHLYNEDGSLHSEWRVYLEISE